MYCLRIRRKYDVLSFTGKGNLAGNGTGSGVQPPQERCYRDVWRSMHQPAAGCRASDTSNCRDVGLAAGAGGHSRHARTQFSPVARKAAKGKAGLARVFEFGLRLER